MNQDVRGASSPSRRLERAFQRGGIDSERIRRELPGERPFAPQHGGLRAEKAQAVGALDMRHAIRAMPGAVGLMIMVKVGSLLRLVRATVGPQGAQQRAGDSGEEEQ